jgi:hypothetical protein
MVWIFSERLINNGKCDEVWSELETQPRRKGYRVRKERFGAGTVPRRRRGAGRTLETN